jgi:hypothetical protein
MAKPCHNRDSMRRGRVRSAFLLSLLLWSGAAISDPEPAARRLESAWLQGAPVRLLPDAASADAPLNFGPWQIGRQLSDSRPKDARHNLYVVAPGRQNHMTGKEDYDCDLVIGFAPEAGALVEWDVIWAIVLDPKLDQELQAERDLIVQAQQSFIPSDLFSLEDVPGRAALRELGFTSTELLSRLRKKDGRLPRVLLVPSKRAVRMGVVPAS